MNIYSAQQSYLHDAGFKRAVDAIESWIREAHVTPAEVRAAAMLACLHFEEKRPAPRWIPDGIVGDSDGV